MQKFRFQSEFFFFFYNLENLILKRKKVMIIKINRIVLEGGEGTGKSTLLKLLKEEFPADTFTAEPFKEATIFPEILKWKNGELDLDEVEETLLFAQQRKELNHSVFIPAMENNTRVWSDRSIISNLVYQFLRTPLSRNEILELNQEVDSEFSLPDLVILLDGDPKSLRERLQKNKRRMDVIDSEDIHFHYQVREEFLKLSQEEGFPVTFLVLDAFAAPEENVAKIKEYLKQKQS